MKGHEKPIMVLMKMRMDAPLRNVHRYKCGMIHDDQCQM